MKIDSKFLTYSVVFWLPIMYFMTYLGFYQAYQYLSTNHILDIDYPNIPESLIAVFSVIPTGFTAHNILNRRRIIFDAIEKIKSFHEHVDDDASITSFYLSEKEYDSLDLDNQIMYCRDLRRAGDMAKANKYLDEIYEKHIDSSNDRNRAIAHYTKSLTSPNYAIQFENSLEAYNLVKTDAKDEIFFRIMWAYIVDSVFLGYKESLDVTEQVEADLNPTFRYWHLRMFIRKNFLHWRIDSNFNVDFENIENQFNLGEYTKDQLSGLEASYNGLKKEVLLHNERYDEFEQLVNNRMYYRKWLGRKYDGQQNDLARLFRLQGKHEESINLHRQILSRRMSINSPSSTICTVQRVNIAKNFLDMENYVECEKTAMEAYKSAKERDWSRGVIESLTLVVESRNEMNLDTKEFEALLEAEEDWAGISVTD